MALESMYKARAQLAASTRFEKDTTYAQQNLNAARIAQKIEKAHESEWGLRPEQVKELVKMLKGGGVL